MCELKPCPCDMREMAQELLEKRKENADLKEQLEVHKAGKQIIDELRKENASLHQEVIEQIAAYENLKQQADDEYERNKELMANEEKHLALIVELVENSERLAGYLLDYDTAHGERIFKQHKALMKQVKGE